jgi:hypothetical protein
MNKDINKLFDTIIENNEPQINQNNLCSNCNVEYILDTYLICPSCGICIKILDTYDCKPDWKQITYIMKPYSRKKYFISKLEALKLSKVDKQCIICKFNRIKMTLRDLCVKHKRKYFLSYNYILIELLKLTNNEQYVPKIKKLKTKYNIIQHNEIWKKVIDILGLSYDNMYQ